MEDYTVYRLKFKTQLHLGRSTGAAQTGSLGLEKTETYIPADTLFSAICQTWATFYGAASLTDFLNQYTAENGTLPFTLTSAFPYADNVYFFPKPLTWQDTEGRSKESKRVQFVSQSIFQEIVSGKAPPFAKEHLINAEKVWVSPDEKAGLKDPDIWKTATRPRVTIGAQNAGSEIWHVQTVQFNKNCGLWFAADFNGNDETKQKIETLLRVLGDSGIGGERNAGYGQFEFAKAECKIPSVENSKQFVTLSPICPKSSDQLEHLLKGDIAYTLSQCSGRVGAFGSGARRKRVNMFAEGSVLNTTDTQVGQLVNLTPDNSPHCVYRYGYAWQIGINDTSKPVGAVS